MKKRIMALSLSVLMLLTVASGCGNKASTESAATAAESTASTSTEATAAQAEKTEAPKPVTITVGEWPKENDAQNRAVWEGVVKKLQEKYPYITIKQDEWSYDVNTFLPRAASGQLPTVYGTFFTEPTKIINAGYAADVTDIVKKLGWDTAINSKFMEIITKDGKYFGVPKDGYAMGLWYNLKLMKQAGLVDDKGMPKFAKTYDELAEMAKTIKEKTGKAGFFFPTKNNQGGWQFMNIAWSFGAEFEKQVDGKWTAVFNSPEAVAALQYLKDLKFKYNALQDNVLTDINDMFKMYGTDQVGIAYGMHYWKNDPTNNFKMSKDDIAMSATPAGPSAAKCVTGGSAYMFAAESTPEQLDAAFKWLEELGFSPKVDAESLKGFEATQKSDSEANRPVGPHGMRVWVNPERVQAEDEIYKKYTNVNMDLWNDFVLNAEKNIKPEEPQYAQELYKILDSVIQKALVKKDSDPKALLDKAVADFQSQYLDKIK